MDENHDHEHPETVTPSQPKNLFRKHTFLEKGPGRRETRDYLMSQAIFIHTPKGQPPLELHVIGKRLMEERIRRYPGQMSQNGLAMQRKADKSRRKLQRKMAEVQKNNVITGNIQTETNGEVDPTCFVYILQSSVDGRLYTGTTNNLVNRLALHNAGKGAKSTRAGRPWTMVYQAKFDTRGDALREEARIKKLSRTEKFYIIREEARAEQETSK